eukprot:gene37057-45711_t
MYGVGDYGASYPANYSSNFGVTWSASVSYFPNYGGGRVACSGNGQYVLAISYYQGYLFLSSDYGHAKVSLSGQYLVAIAYGQNLPLQFSDDFGVTWYSSSSPVVYYTYVTADSTRSVIYAI